jgi:DNA-binding CsgD family transcriptional regulator
MSAQSDEFEHHFAAAVLLHGQTPDVFELRVTRLAYGGSLRRQRQRPCARSELRMTLEILKDWAPTRGLKWHAATSSRPARRRGASATETLTRRELRIAQTLASGKTTREAAAALILSPKTIEYHLRSIYGNLGVSSPGRVGFGDRVA